MNFDLRKYRLSKIEELVSGILLTKGKPITVSAALQNLDNINPELVPARIRAREQALLVYLKLIAAKEDAKIRLGAGNTGYNCQIMLA